jgi:hypothetical protein
MSMITIMMIMSVKPFHAFNPYAYVVSLRIILVPRRSYVEQ